MNLNVINFKEIKKPQKLPNGTMVEYVFGGISLYIWTHRNVWTPTEFTFGMCELIVEENLKDKEVLDFGCGSGILGILALKCGARFVTFTDINEKALEMTKRNLEVNQINSDSYEIILSDKFEYFEKNKQKISVDVIISNLPSIPSLGESKKEKNAKEWNENGKDGRDVTDALITKAKQYLKQSGFIIFVTTSKQGANTTIKVLDENFGIGTYPKDIEDSLDYIGMDIGEYNWKVIKRVDKQITESGFKYLDIIKQVIDTTKNPPLFYTAENGDVYQKLYFIKANTKES